MFGLSDGPGDARARSRTSPSCAGPATSRSARCAWPPNRPVWRPRTRRSSQALLGNLLVYSGDPDGAAEAYRGRTGPRPDTRPVTRRTGAAGDRGGQISRTAIALLERASDDRALARVRHRAGRHPGGRRAGRTPRRASFDAGPGRDPAVRGERASWSISISRCSRRTTAIRPGRSNSPQAALRRGAHRPRRRCRGLGAPPTRAGRAKPGRTSTRRCGSVRATRCSATTPARSRPPLGDARRRARDLSSP